MPQILYGFIVFPTGCQLVGDITEDDLAFSSAEGANWLPADGPVVLQEGDVPLKKKIHISSQLLLESVCPIQIVKSDILPPLTIQTGVIYLLNWF